MNEFTKVIVPKIDAANWAECVEASKGDAFCVVPRCRGCEGEVYHIYQGCLPQLTIEDAKTMAVELHYRDYRILRWPSGEFIE